MSLLKHTLPFSSLVLLLAACNSVDTNWKQPNLKPRSDTGRWYSEEQARTGRELFNQTCAACHNKDAAGTSDWKTPNANGDYPPPPLNGTAHAWHHSIDVLAMTIEEGGAKFGGQMPGFKSQYTEEQILALIAGFQQFWSDGIYQSWLEREKFSRD